MRRRPANGNDPHIWDCASLQALEQTASMPAILKAVQEGIAAGKETGLRLKNGPISFADVTHAAQIGDPFVSSVLANVAQTLGWVCCQLNALFNPQKIILAGPLVSLGAAFLHPLQEAVNEFCAETGQVAPVIVDSELGIFNGVRCCAQLHEWKT